MPSYLPTTYHPSLQVLSPLIDVYVNIYIYTSYILLYTPTPSFLPAISSFLAGTSNLKTLHTNTIYILHSKKRPCVYKRKENPFNQKTPGQVCMW